MDLFIFHKCGERKNTVGHRWAKDWDNFEKCAGGWINNCDKHFGVTTKFKVC